MTIHPIDGFAKCVHPSCTSVNELRPIALVRETVEKRGYPGEAFASITLGVSEYLHAVDDSDMACPTCGLPSALLDSEPHVYPKAPR